jgi:hypothetical protein
MKYVERKLNIHPGCTISATVLSSLYLKKIEGEEDNWSLKFCQTKDHPSYLGVGTLLMELDPIAVVIYGNKDDLKKDLSINPACSFCCSTSESVGHSLSVCGGCRV